MPWEIDGDEEKQLRSAAEAHNVLDIAELHFAVVHVVEPLYWLEPVLKERGYKLDLRDGVLWIKEART